MQNDFSFCPSCGKSTIRNINGRKWSCSNCGFSLYNNVASAVGIILTDNQRNVLFEIRAKDPRKGFLAIPGGFCDPDETAEQAAVRECKEELGLEPETLTYLCSFPNTYEYKHIVYKTCDLFFTATIRAVDGCTLLSQLHQQESEVSGCVIKPVGSVQDIEKLPLAFESTRKTLLLWLKKRKDNE